MAYNRIHVYEFICIFCRINKCKYSKYMSMYDIFLFVRCSTFDNIGIVGAPAQHSTAFVQIHGMRYCFFFHSLLVMLFLCQQYETKVEKVSSYHFFLFSSIYTLSMHLCSHDLHVYMYISKCILLFVF